ncbi:MAG: hypothetical protein ABI688_01505 [Bacteroidota bacterium]
MKKLLLLLLAFLPVLRAPAQDQRKIESADSFFAGVPLQKSYENWVLYIATHFGIDSSNKTGVYSSFKPDTKSHFPFPDSVPVKILLYTAVNTQVSAKIPVDTVRYILIEGVYAGNKIGRKDAYAYFDQLRRMLKVYYKKNSTYAEDAAYFSGSINKNFPDITLERGYIKERDFYYVILMCMYDYWTNY